jgi:hypothetical protein
MTSQGALTRVPYVRVIIPGPVGHNRASRPPALAGRGRAASGAKGAKWRRSTFGSTA